MGIKYEPAEDILKRLVDIAHTLSMEHVRFSGVYAIRSRGSGSSRTLARCHAMGKIWQKAMGINAIYIIEVLSEKFDKLSRDEQDNVLIHELMHIPFTFGGGFKHHDVVNEKNVNKLHQQYMKLKGRSADVPEINYGDEPIIKEENEDEEETYLFDDDKKDGWKEKIRNWF